MTDKQPEALRLAECLDRQFLHACKPAAVELRRLHEVNFELVDALDCLMKWQVKNVKVWNNSAYDNAHIAITKAAGEEQ